MLYLNKDVVIGSSSPQAGNPTKLNFFLQIFGTFCPIGLSSLLTRQTRGNPRFKQSKKGVYKKIQHHDVVVPYLQRYIEIQERVFDERTPFAMIMI